MGVELKSFFFGLLHDTKGLEEKYSVGIFS